jgi:VanZ family protein
MRWGSIVGFILVDPGSPPVDRDLGTMLPRYEQIRFDDRSPDGMRVGLTVKPPVLRRQTIFVLAMLMIAAVVYGTLVPFNFRPRQNLDWRLTISGLHAGDALANALVYVPLGVLLRLILRRRGSRWPVECLATVLIATSISYTAEVLQQWLPGRVPTLTDTLCNAGGALIGTAIAPAAQKRLRQFHAWLYQAMQTAPFTAVAGLLTVFIGVYALAPFDIRPTAHHVATSLNHLAMSWPTGSVDAATLSPPAILNKWVAAAAYGVLAFLLTLSGREAGRSGLTSAWHALTRSSALVAAIELVQLFTASHVADGNDMSRAWACCTGGTLLAVGLLWMRPLIYRDPAALVGPALPIVCPVLLAWLIVAILKDFGRGQADGLEWLPVMANFQRSWDSLLFSYTSGLINYTLAVGTVAAWMRLRGQTPRLGHCLATALVAALVLQSIALLVFGAFPDTGHVALAVVAGLAVHRLDRAMFGRRMATI